MTPETIYFHITRACNLQCRYCYFSAGEPMRNELPKNSIIKQIKDIYELRPNRVVITGGEPLLREDFFEIMNSFKAIHNKASKLCISTNGTLVSEKNANYLVELFDEIRISIDGQTEVNDYLRGTGTFKRAMQALNSIRRAGGEPVAYVTVTSANLNSLPDFIDSLLQQGILRIHLSPVKLFGRAFQNNNLLCNEPELKKITEDFWSKKFGIQFNSENKKEYNCGIGKYINIYPNGSVYPCHLLSYHEFCVGTLTQDKLSTIYYQSTLMNKLRDLDLRLFDCSKYLQEDSRIGSCMERIIGDAFRNNMARPSGT